MFIVYNVEILCNVTQKKQKKTIVLLALGDYRSYFKCMKYGCIHLEGWGGGWGCGTRSKLALKGNYGVLQMKQLVVRGLELATGWGIGERGVGGVRGGM